MHPCLWRGAFYAIESAEGVESAFSALCINAVEMLAGVARIEELCRFL